MNDEAVYRTALAKPGLLKRGRFFLGGGGSRVGAMMWQGGAGVGEEYSTDRLYTIEIELEILR